MTKKAIKKTNKSTKQINNPKFKTREEFRKLLTPLTVEEYKTLEESICRDGLREPLVVWKEKGILVDGHTRHDICKKHGRKFRIIEMPFDNEDEVKLWIWDNQEGRRNMTPFRRVEVVLNLKSIIAEQAKKNQRKGGGRKVNKDVYGV
jgi:ParB-like chromosome segregation protein Spo0J